MGPDTAEQSEAVLQAKPSTGSLRHPRPALPHPALPRHAPPRPAATCPALPRRATPRGAPPGAGIPSGPSVMGKLWSEFPGDRRNLRHPNWCAAPSNGLAGLKNWTANNSKVMFYQRRQNTIRYTRPLNVIPVQNAGAVRLVLKERGHRRDHLNTSCATERFKIQI